MRRKSLGATVFAAGLAVLACAASAHAQATRTWVSGTGDDANDCSRATPCKTFAGTIGRTAALGTINCADPGGFGTVSITISITIDCTGTMGSVLASGTNGININGAGIHVILRGLEIEGSGSGVTGINFISGGSLTVEDTVVHRFSGGSPFAAIQFAPNSAAATLMLNNVTLINSGSAPASGGGLVINPAAGGSAVVIVHNSRIENNASGIQVNSQSGSVTMTVRDTTIANNRGDGINASAGNPILLMVERATISSNFQNGIVSSGANATIRLNNSTVAGNSTGVSISNGGSILSFKNNAIKGNGNNGTPLPQESFD